MPAARPRAGSLPAHESLDLAALFGSEWEGFRISRAGLQVPGWRGPIPGPDMRALFWTSQHARILARDLDRARAELSAALAALDHAESRARWYRSQLVMEARAGLMLSRIVQA